MRYADDEGLSGNRRQALVSHYRAQQKQLSGQLEYPCEYPYSHSHSVGHMKSSEESPNKPHKCTKEVTHAAPLGRGNRDSRWLRHQQWEGTQEGEGRKGSGQCLYKARIGAHIHLEFPSSEGEGEGDKDDKCMLNNQNQPTYYNFIHSTHTHLRTKYTLCIYMCLIYMCIYTPHVCAYLYT